MSSKHSQPIFDAHFHILDKRYPLIANQGYLPEEFSVRDYLARMSGYHVIGGCVVSGSFQAMDQSYLIDALQKLGRGFAGVTQIPVTVSDEQLWELHAAQVRAVRFNIRRGGSEHVAELERMARRIHELVGWHVELYVDARELVDLYDLVRRLPAVSIDHLGLSREGLPVLLKLAERGVRVKASGFGRVDFDVKTALRDFYAANPAALMFGSDLPSTRAPTPFTDGDVALIRDALESGPADQVLFQNALEFYRL